MSTATQAKQELIDAGGRAAETFGFSRLLGQIYMLLYLAPEPMSLDAQSAALSISKASISIACRQLEGWGIIRKIWVKGDRKDYYEAERDPRRLFQGGLLGALRRKTHSAGILIGQCLDVISKDGAGDCDGSVRFMKQQLEVADRYRARIEAAMDCPLVETFLTVESPSDSTS